MDGLPYEKIGQGQMAVTHYCNGQLGHNKRAPPLSLTQYVKQSYCTTSLIFVASSIEDSVPAAKQVAHHASAVQEGKKIPIAERCEEQFQPKFPSLCSA